MLLFPHANQGIPFRSCPPNRTVFRLTRILVVALIVGGRVSSQEFLPMDPTEGDATDIDRRRHAIAQQVEDPNRAHQGKRDRLCPGLAPLGQALHAGSFCGWAPQF